MPSQCLPKDITITPAEGRVHVFFDDAEIVSSTRALALDEPGEQLCFYFPLEEIRPDLLLDSDTRKTSDYLGEASYFNLRSATASADDAVWYYPEPCPLVEAIRGHVAFLGDRIRIERTEI